MDQGIALLAYYSLMRVARGFMLGILIGTPLGFMLGMSKTLQRIFDPILQVLRPISPLAWLPLGLIIFQKSEPAALFAIAVCSMWPTVINTMVGVRSIPQDYWNVAKVLRLSVTTFTKIVFRRRCRTSSRATVSTWHRVARHRGQRVLTARRGRFLWQDNSLIYAHILLAISIASSASPRS
jgi:nitrate/nitrite transport system permease protein